MSVDVRIIETLDGGDAVLSGNDLELVNQLDNQVYLALFGGNTEESTPQLIDNDNRIERFDFWGNSLFHPDEPTFQFNSAFERSLSEIPLNTEGIQRLEQIALTDLAYLREFGNLTVSITAQSVNRICIDVRIQLKPRFGDLVTVSLDLVIRPVDVDPTPTGTIYEPGIYEPGIYE